MRGRRPRSRAMLDGVLRPITAWPNDWTGWLARVGWWVLLVLGFVTVLLVRLPERWVALALGQPLVVRVVIGFLAWSVARAIRPWVIARLPRAASLFRGTLAVSPRGPRRRIPLSEIAHVDVERRPPPVDEALVVELKDGTTHEVCPIAWDGGARLYEALARRITPA